MSLVLAGCDAEYNTKYTVSVPDREACSSTIICTLTIFSLSMMASVLDSFPKKTLIKYTQFVIISQ